MFELPFRVAYLDTDAMGVVHHSRYFRYLEQYRIEFMRWAGVSYQELEAQGLMLPLTSVHMEYRKPLRFDEVALVRAHVEQTGKTQCTFHYEIWVGKELSAKARTDHVYVRKVVNADGSSQFKPLRIPEEWSEKWPKLSAKKS